VLSDQHYLAAWLTGFRLASRYFRYECEGFEHVRAGPALLVAYHGRPHPADVFMLSVRIYDELGYMLPAVWATTWGEVPALRGLVSALGGFYGEPSAEQMARLIAEGRHLVVCPGGTREALRPAWQKTHVDWGERRGYLRLAARHGLPILPVAASGVDRMWFGLNDGYRLSKRLFGHGGWPVWLGVGFGGVWPFALPWPVRVRQRIGEPIDVREFGSLDDPAALEAAHCAVTGKIQSMLEELEAA